MKDYNASELFRYKSKKKTADHYLIKGAMLCLNCVLNIKEYLLLQWIFVYEHIYDYGREARLFPNTFCTLQSVLKITPATYGPFTPFLSTGGR